MCATQVFSRCNMSLQHVLATYPFVSGHLKFDQPMASKKVAKVRYSSKKLTLAGHSSFHVLPCFGSAADRFWSLVSQSVPPLFSSGELIVYIHFGGFLPRLAKMYLANQCAKVFGLF